MIDNDLILYASPDYVAGRRKGLTDEETEQYANETYCELERFYERNKAHKWSEDKPEGECRGILIRIEFDEGGHTHRVISTEDVEVFGRYISYWWELPEVTE